MIQHEAALKADSFLVMAHGSADEIARPKLVLGTAGPFSVPAAASTKRLSAGKDFDPVFLMIAAR